jgi:hypothetical protein
MGFTEAIRVALQSLWANKLRTVLTLIGVVIGVASVIAIITLVNGANRFVATKISGYGSDVLTVTKMPSVIQDAEEYLRDQKRKDIEFSDYEYIAQTCTRCQSVGAQLTPMTWLWGRTLSTIYCPMAIPLVRRFASTAKSIRLSAWRSDRAQRWGGAGTTS